MSPMPPLSQKSRTMLALARPAEIEGVGAREVVVAGHRLGVDGEHDHLDPLGQSLELAGEPGVDGDEERRQHALDGASVRCGV